MIRSYGIFVCFSAALSISSCKKRQDNAAVLEEGAGGIQYVAPNDDGVAGYLASSLYEVMVTHARNPANEAVHRDGMRLTIGHNTLDSISCDTDDGCTIRLQQATFTGGRSSAAGVLGVGGIGIATPSRQRTYPNPEDYELDPNSVPRIVCTESVERGVIPVYTCQFFGPGSSPTPIETAEPTPMESKTIFACSITDKTHDLFPDELDEFNSKASLDRDEQGIHTLDLGDVTIKEGRDGCRYSFSRRTHYMTCETDVKHRYRLKIEPEGSGIVEWRIGDQAYEWLADLDACRDG